MLHIGVLQLTLDIHWSTSLKDKRQVVKSLKDRLRQQFNVSVAEVEDQDDRRTATLGVVMAGSDTRYLNGALDRIVELLGRHPDAELAGHQIEIL